jgi:hypothetical protein
MVGVGWSWLRSCPVRTLVVAMLNLWVLLPHSQIVFDASANITPVSFVMYICLHVTTQPGNEPTASIGQEGCLGPRAGLSVVENTYILP